MVDLPARKMGTTNVPPFALCVRGENECALPCTNQYPNSAHKLLLPTILFFPQSFAQSMRQIRTQSRMLIRGQARDLPHRPDFDSSDARPWTSNSDADRLVDILGIDQEVAGDLFAGFHERTVGHETFAVADPNDRRRRRRM